MHAEREDLQVAEARKDSLDLDEREARLVAGFLNDELADMRAKSGTSGQERVKGADARGGLGLDLAKHDFVVERTQASAQWLGRLLLGVCELEDTLQELVRQFREAVDTGFSLVSCGGEGRVHAVSWGDLGPTRREASYAHRLGTLQARDLHPCRVLLPRFEGSGRERERERESARGELIVSAFHSFLAQILLMHLYFDSDEHTILSQAKYCTIAKTLEAGPTHASTMARIDGRPQSPSSSSSSG